MHRSENNIIINTTYLLILSADESEVTVSLFRFSVRLNGRAGGTLFLKSSCVIVLSLPKSSSALTVRRLQELGSPMLSDTSQAVNKENHKVLLQVNMDGTAADQVLSTLTVGLPRSRTVALHLFFFMKTFWNSRIIYCYAILELPISQLFPFGFFVCFSLLDWQL